MLLTTCILWVRKKDRKGYGVFGHNGRRKAHRWAYEQKHGTIPKGMVVRHLCHHRACINVEHLAIGTVADNHRDMDEAGRRARGFALPHTRLSEDDVNFIRENADQIPHSLLANWFGVSRGYVWRLAHGERRSRVPCS